MAGKKPYRNPIQNDEKFIYREPDGLLHFRVPMPEKPGLAGPADSKWSTGRNCPKCAGQMEFFELTEGTELVIVRCKQCLSKFYESDLDPQNFDPLDEKDKETLPYDNVLFRMIPDDRIIYYMERIDRKKQKENRED